MVWLVSNPDPDDSTIYGIYDEQHLQEAKHCAWMAFCSEGFIEDSPFQVETITNESLFQAEKAWIKSGECMEWLWGFLLNDTPGVIYDDYERFKENNS